MAPALGAGKILVQIQVSRLPLCAGADNPECRWHKPHTALSVWSRRLSCRGSGRQSPSRWPTGFSEGKRGYLRMALLVYIVLGGKNPNQHTTALHGPETSSRRIGLSPASAGRGDGLPRQGKALGFVGATASASEAVRFRSSAMVVRLHLFPFHLRWKCN